MPRDPQIYDILAGKSVEINKVLISYIYFVGCEHRHLHVHQNLQECKYNIVIKVSPHCTYG